MKNNWFRLFAIASLIVIVGVSVPVLGAGKKPVAKVKTGAICPKPAPNITKTAQKTAATKAKAKPAAAKALPRLLDLGSKTCVPCKMMAPILDQLTKEYKGKLTVEFIDVWKDQASARKYKVQSIPTQIFYDAKGKELYRHVGYYSKDDILKAFKDKGINLVK